MGRRWKQRLASIDTTPSQPPKTVKMIEHSISPYPVTSTNYYQNNQTRKVTMNKEEYEALPSLLVMSPKSKTKE